MIYGIGTDIIEVNRIEKRLSGNNALLDRLYTRRERDYCDSANRVKYQCYAARFAAKEAFFKALGTGYRYGMAFHEIEVLNDSLGKPYIEPAGKVKEFILKNNITRIHLSISHIKETATAFVVLETA